MTVRRFVAAVATVIVATLGVVHPASGQQATDPATAEVELASQTSWLASGQSLDLALDLLHLTHADRIDVVVDVYRSVRSQREFDDSLQNRFPSARVMGTGTKPLIELPTDADGAYVLSVALPPLSAGVYPVSIVLRDRERRVDLDRLVTHAVRVAETVAQPLRVAWVQPLSAPPSLQPDGELRVDQDIAMAILRLTGAIAVQSTVPMTIDVTPEMLAAYRAEMPETAAAIRAATRGRQVLAAPFVEVEPTAIVAADRGADLSAQRVAGDVELREALGASGDPRSWSSDTPLSPAAASQLRSMGVSQIVVPAEGLGAVNPTSVEGRSLDRPFALDAGDGTTVGAVVADEGLAVHFDDDHDQVLAAHQLLADLAVRHADWPGVLRGVVIRPPTDWESSSVFVGTVLAGLATATIVRPVTLDGLFAEVPPLMTRGRAVVRSATDAKPIQPIDSLPIDEARTAIEGLRALTPGAVVDDAKLTRMLLISESTDLNTSERRAYLNGVIARQRAVQLGIRLVDGRTFRLAGRSGTIPLTLVNDNPFPTVVTLELTSEKLEFQDGIGPDRSTRIIQSIELGANQRTVVPVDVRARASAAFSLRAVLRVPSTGEELGRSRYTVVSPAVPGVGIALSVGAGLFLVVWWVRNWRSSRRTTVTAPTPPDAGAGSAAA